MRLHNGATQFQYDESWLHHKNSFPISCSMPLSNEIFSGSTVEYFFSGLLPDDQDIRETIASRESAESANIFDLLVVIGRDCVGALRFLPQGSPSDEMEMRFTPVSDDKIAQKLENLGNAPLGNDQDSENNFRISIAGMQEKTAFLQMEGKWCTPLGVTPTSHIFKTAISNKPNGADLSNSPWNEWLSLLLCENLGLPSAKSEVKYFNRKPVLIVERFDRMWVDNTLYRIPQEDLCQALSIPPNRKYQSDGGPNIQDVMELLNSSITPLEDRCKFMKAQIVFWLLGAIDGHAKNFSIFLKHSGHELTPLYDVMSAAPYSQFPIQKMKLAMAIGNKNYYKIQQIQLRHFYQTAQKAHLAKENMDEIVNELSNSVDQALSVGNKACNEKNAPGSEVEPILEMLAKRAKIIR
ncbi:MAG: type II toxin-antitoxin system HipA family toxin [Gammaproteobacteria bacterium]|jgi:serine/threonine-protein kinase HipA|nr:type II toxin-antitoxin system HipA family toxin [Gammaproteobacteria bacterium]MBT5370484.1 type II toxin-antitoxin system HipA family toxin [Gammaproteobacteria bacterium]MBT6478929.1 type II toxin-antitoxin system HipA family toxin [Gammaproteobacteria bacterium]MBT6879995.1 type II toxin-antitoxin system HipA family toxin [Gammaproteobacteria bacterium]MBT7140275.1 type II toxin-antitoxin system HipA family toxin [Gammaproteobacteria bacterium]